MSQKPSLPKGTRDFGPEQMAKRNLILDAIKSTFQQYGFMPLETPAMENLEVLTGKYGDEGDQLLFKILNSGDYLSKVNQPLQTSSKDLLPQIASKGLRYDLTVPFARYVVMNQHDIAYPFKRYQIQPVWRADRPQKGRYREFFQCDADVVGTDSLLCEAEIIGMINQVLTTLGISDYNILINNRKVLTGITEAIGAKGKEQDFFVAIDKLNKIGLDNVLKELQERGLSSEAIEAVKPILALSGTTTEVLSAMKNLLAESEIGSQGLREIDEVLTMAEKSSLDLSKVQFDVTLARGLSYYTGAIFEVAVNNVSIGSISGGGRYDDLTGVFGLKNVSGVGFSFGVDRIYDVMEELNLFQSAQLTYSKVLIVHFDQPAFEYGMGILSQLRNAGISSELYPESVKIKKQFTYADRKNVEFVIIIGSNEMESGKLTLRNMKSGEESAVQIPEIIKMLS